MKPAVITRFPPSPTGFFHIGGARTALYNHLFAAHNGGKMLLRFEDTDKGRSSPEFEKDIIAGLNWLGIPYELANPARQSERTEIYKKYLHQLIDSGKAYEAETRKEDPTKKVIRFRNPPATISFDDAIRGTIEIDTQTLNTQNLKDFIIARSIDEPLYHLAVVIDDHEMGVTHVIRGEDHTTNTPRQILLLEALGFKRPQYAHIPLILAPDKSKLSKRHGAVSVNEYKSQGFIPEAMLNYLALLGWNPGGNEEIFTLSELIQKFDLTRVQKSDAVFDIIKLKWFNREHLKRLSNTDYINRLESFLGKTVDNRLIPLLKETASTLKEAQDLIEVHLDFLSKVSLDSNMLVQGGNINAEVASNHLRNISALLENIPDEGFNATQLKDIIWPYAKSQGTKEVVWPFRVALSGKEKSPDPFTIAELLGKQESLGRIARAVEKL